MDEELSGSTRDTKGSTGRRHRAATSLGLKPVRDSFWGWFRGTARLWGFLGFICCILIIFRAVILPFAIAVLLSYVLAPLLRAMCRFRLADRTLPRAAWLVVLYAGLLGLMALFLTLLVPRLSHELRTIDPRGLAQRVRSQWLPSAAGWLQQNFGVEQAERPAQRDHRPGVRLKQHADGTVELDTRGVEIEVVRTGDDRWLLRAPATEGNGADSEQIEGMMRRLVVASESGLAKLVVFGQHLVLAVMSAVTAFILILMVSAFLLLDADRILRWLKQLIPPDHHHDFDVVTARLDRALSGAVRGQLIICVVNGILTGLGLAIFQVKYALLLGILAGILSLIPIFGSILSTIPIVVVALLSGTGGLDFLKGAAALGWIVLIHLVEANFLNPKIIGSAAKIHPVVVVFSVVAGQHTYGAAGALLAVPIVSTVQAVFVYLRQRVADGDEA